MMTRIFRALGMTAVLIAALMLCACNQNNSAVQVKSFDTETITVTTSAQPTHIPLDTVHSSLCTADLRWSMLNRYIYTEVSEGVAEFTVTHEAGNLTLYVEYDEAADTVSKADLTYGDVTVSILTNNRFVLHPIIVALQGE